jgi:hypothetical protein
MYKRFGVSLSLVLLVILASTPIALAQGGVTPQHTAPYWQAAYWNNTSLSGQPILQRNDAELNFDWGAGSPAAGVWPDQFSARWTRYIEVTPGVYRFTVTSDDGIRVWLDGELIVNEWNDHAAKTVAVDRHIGAGHHLVTVEYYENTGRALAQVSWAPAAIPIQNWRGEYFDNPWLSGSPTLTRDDPSIHFNWGYASPAPGYVGQDYFSVRWTRTQHFAAGSYRFTVVADDGVRLWVNGHHLIDAWVTQAPTTYIGEIYLPGGAVEIKMEYYENNGGAVAQLAWAPATGPVPPPQPPTGAAVIVDDSSNGFSKGGKASSWRTAWQGYGDGFTYTRNNDYSRPQYNWARWYPGLTAGRYEVFVYIPGQYATTTQARYWVSHAGGYTLRTVNQYAYSNQWVSLGAYQFRGNSQDYISLSDVTYEPYLSRYVGFDAAKWEPRP